MKGRILKDRLATALLWACMGTTLAILGGILLFLVARGAGSLSWEFFTQPPARFHDEGRISTPLVGTIQLVFVAMAFAFPVGILTAVT
jgi:phosphate transport system permease protein